MTKIKIFLFIVLAIVATLRVWMNSKYEVEAVHSFFGGEDYELRVLTWNVHRSAIADEEQQIEMVKVVGTELSDHNMLVADFSIAPLPYT